jgi:hypothetical protein
MSAEIVAEMPVDYIAANLEITEERAQDILDRAKQHSASA